ncbi:MAG: NTP transferase domain-containing protein [Elusimicrobiota bacterium]
MEKTFAVIIARAGSTRLPAKALMPIAGKPMLERLVERARRSRRLSGVGIATTTLPGDDAIAALARELGAPCHRGSEENINERVCGAAREFSCEVVAELLGDNPLVHAALIDDVLALRAREDADYAANLTREYPHSPGLPRFPVGIRVQAYRVSAARRWSEFPKLFNSPLGTNSFIFTNPEVFRCAYLEARGPWSGLLAPDMGFPVNYQREFDLVERIFSDLLPKDPDFSLADVMAWVRAHPAEYAAATAKDEQDAARRRPA